MYSGICCVKVVLSRVASTPAPTHALYSIRFCDAVQDWVDRRRDLIAGLSMVEFEIAAGAPRFESFKIGGIRGLMTEFPV